MWFCSAESGFACASPAGAVCGDSSFLRSPAETCNHRPSKYAAVYVMVVGSTGCVLSIWVVGCVVFFFPGT